MTRFRPCIDLHDGKVKQIVGGTLDTGAGNLQTNFVSDQAPAHYAAMYAADQLTGGHVIQLGPGNKEAALSALQAYPNGLQLGGGINLDNATELLEAGASHVIVTSMLFDQAGRFQQATLQELVDRVGKERLVLDLSCRRVGHNSWKVAMNRWQTITELAVTKAVLVELATYADEFLIHAADVEGKCQGVDEDLVQHLGDWVTIPTTYAGGARDLDDLQRVHTLSQGKVDLTIGSALDIFGGNGVTYAECLSWNRGDIL